MVLTLATKAGAFIARATASAFNQYSVTLWERLSTGKRVKAASDYAAVVAIVSRLTSEIRGTKQAILNPLDGLALLATAEGAHIEHGFSAKNVHDCNTGSE